MEDRRKIADGKEIWVIKAGFPNDPVKRLWSEYAFSNSLKKYLERLGVCVFIESYDEWYGNDTADVVVVLRGHKEYFPVRKNKDCVHIMWNLSHPSTITDEEYNSYDMVCIGSEIYAEKIKRRLKVPVRILPVCADTERFFPDSEEKEEKEYDWVFVGNSRYVKRKSVVWSITHNIPLKIWGANWEKVLPESAKYVVAENIPNDELPKLYRNAKVTVDDHYEDMALYGFVNTRIIEAVACGLPVISDYSEGIYKMFGDAVLSYRNEKEFVEQTNKIFDDYASVKKKTRELWPVIQKEYSFEARARQLKIFSEEIKEYGNRCRKLATSFSGHNTTEHVIRTVCERSSGLIPKVSVIIPVYNAVKYLEKCLDSVLRQTLKEIEIICIDDGSEDSSLKLLKEYADKDDRISVYAQKNCGLAETRNRGLGKAQGEYIAFLDSDDWLELQALERLYEASRKRQLDILVFNGDTVYDNDKVREEYPEFQNYYHRKGKYPEKCAGYKMLAGMRKEKEYRTSAVMQMFRRQFLENTRTSFCRGILHEDNDFTFRSYLSAENVGYMPENFYKRQVHNDSIMTKAAECSGLRHVYGYFKAFLNMRSFLADKELYRDFDAETWEAVMDILEGTLYNVRKYFSNLTWQEQCAFDMLDKSDALDFRFYVQPGFNSFSALGKAQKEKSELNRKLQNTYAEKSEINRKLQITYKEKYDRGLEIKYLNKELASIKKSKTYRLARIIGFPVRTVRKIMKKLQE